MAITKTFNRPKLDTTLSKNVSISAAVAEVSDGFAVDITITVTKDDTSTVTKTAVRALLPLAIKGTTLEVGNSFYTFPGSATTYSSGGTTPSLSAGTKGNTVELNSWLTAVGDAPENS
jgi:hypothetical protein